ARSRAFNGSIERSMSATHSTDAPKRAAKHAGLRYVNPMEPGLRRLKIRAGFRYLRQNNQHISNQTLLDRIQRLVIPPAWKDVWICPDAKGHIQAIGRDARGRKQYIYHPKWSEVRDEDKFHRMLEFGK